MKKAKQIINIIMGTSVGVFIGHSIYVIWNLKTRPELYARQSAPWYISILVYGIFTLIVLVVCFLLKVILKYIAKKKDAKPTK